MAEEPPREKRLALIIDDDPQFSKMLSEHLEDMGFDVDAAFDGKEGLVKAAARKPHLILLDIMMPGIHGYEVCSKLRADPHTKNSRILVLSAKGFDSDKEMAREVGADGYLVKPFHRNDLQEKVEALFRA